MSYSRFCSECRRRVPCSQKEFRNGKAVYCDRCRESEPESSDPAIDRLVAAMMDRPAPAVPAINAAERLQKHYRGM
jgi:hypothetical protein